MSRFPKGRSGMLITQGGLFAVGLMLKDDGRTSPTTVQEQVTHITATTALSSGKHIIRSNSRTTAAVGAKGGRQGVLSVDDQQIAKVTSKKTVPNRFSLDETLDAAKTPARPSTQPTSCIQVQRQDQQGNRRMK